MEKVFEPFDLDDANALEITDYHNIGSWEEYMAFFKAMEKPIRRPNFILVSEKSRGIGKDYLGYDEEET